MNSLSWMIYAAEVVEKLGATAMGLVFGSATFFCISIFVTASALDMGDMSKETARFWRKVPVVVGLIALPFAILTPSSQTIYLIAASEAGETVVSSPEAREIFNDLKTVIKSKLKEQLPTVAQ